MVSSVVALVLTYLSVYGFAAWGLQGFTRAVGQVFNPVIVLIFATAVFLGGIVLATKPKLSRRTMSIAIGVAVVSIAVMGAVGLAKGERKMGEHHGGEKTEKPVSAAEGETAK